MVFLLILPLHQVEYDERLIMDFDSVLILGDGSLGLSFLLGIGTITSPGHHIAEGNGAHV